MARKRKKEIVKKDVQEVKTNKEANIILNSFIIYLQNFKYCVCKKEHQINYELEEEIITSKIKITFE